MSGLRIVQVPRAPVNHKAILMEQSRSVLMRQYRDSTSKLLVGLTVDAESANYLWRDLALEMATRYTYFYHGMLAISALHADLLEPSDKTALLALEHRSISLSLFRQALADGTKDFDALFACQCLIVAYSLAAHGNSRFASLAALKDVLTVLRGTKAVVAEAGQSLLSGPFGQMILRNPAAQDFDVPADVEAVLKDLYSRLDTSISAIAYRELYEATLEMLRYVLSLAPYPQYDQIVVMSFMLPVEQEYLNLVFLGEPLALSILGNYAVCLHEVGKRNLFIRGWANQVLRIVRERLPPGWQDSIAWATKEIEG